MVRSLATVSVRLTVSPTCTPRERATSSERTAWLAARPPCCPPAGDSGGVQRCCLSARVNREACPIGGCDVQLVQGIDGDKMVAVGDPAREGLHGDVDFVVRGRLREYVGGDVPDRGRSRSGGGSPLERRRCGPARTRLVTLGGRDIPEGDRADRDDDRQRDQDDRGESPPETLARITRGDAEYHSPSPHPCVESTH